jgi:methionyl-tRNA formyltransferase
MSYRIVYMGTPDFACPALRMLARSATVDVPLVVTQPDRAAGRGRHLQAPPVKRLAVEFGLDVYQTGSLRTLEQRKPILDLEPDLIVVAAFGIILGRSILHLPRFGCLNLHASLLPQYRGASPVSAAIMSGDRETGVTLMKMEQGLDTGPMFARSIVPLTGQETTDSLTSDLATVAADLLASSLSGVFDGTLSATDQPQHASLTRPLVKGDGWIDWSQPADVIERQVRAMWSWPRAWTTLPDGSSLQVHQVTTDQDDGIAPSGHVQVDRAGLRIRCGNGWLRLEVGQLPGGKPLTGRQLASGRPFSNGDIILGAAAGPEVPGPLLSAIDED